MGGRLAILLLGVVSLGVSVFLTCQSWRFRELAEGIAWIPDRSFERPALVMAGTGATHENPNRLGPTTAVGFGSRIALVDAGRGVAEALRRCAIPVAQPDTVLLTSLAPENVVGLDDLALTRWNVPGRPPLRVVGPRGTRALVEAITAAHAKTVAALAEARGVDAAGARLEGVDAGADFEDARDGLAVRAAPVGDRPLASLAYRFEAAGRSFVVSGIRPDEEPLAALATGATTLVGAGFYARSIDMAIEAGAENAEQLRREATLDLPLERLASIATRAGVGTLVATRLEPPPLFDEQFATAIREQFRGRAVIATECDEITP
jgi:ribonuclease BN (tRNA processing enzyme)